MSLSYLIELLHQSLSLAYWPYLVHVISLLRFKILAHNDSNTSANSGSINYLLSPVKGMVNKFFSPV
jgi:hypothetical protein